MAELIVQGLEPQNHWRRTLPDGERLILGRDAGPWTVPWDDRISRQHAELCWCDGRLQVRRLPGARNPIFVDGHESDSFDLYQGDRFVIGSTLFAVSEKRVAPTIPEQDPRFLFDQPETLQALQHVGQLEQRQAALRRFFSPLVLSALDGADPEKSLAPRETEVVVLFCDLRGFSRQVERFNGRLLTLLEMVSDALRMMTEQIQAEAGVVCAFQGDAALGFWGWPVQRDDNVARACRAALAIRRCFEASGEFQIGIGIASGRAVAGRIGTAEQAQVSVFGPPVNLASRLEGMTKKLQVPILMDEATAAMARCVLPANEARFRRLAIVAPEGMEQPLAVTELLPPAHEMPLSDGDLTAYEKALDAFLARRWFEAYDWLHRISPHDRGKDFLTATIAQHRRIAPSDWNGVIALPKQT